MPIRVLLVDDDRPVLEKMSLLLSEEFEIAGMACDGLEMITASERLCPDVILADIAMPRLDGLEASRRILSNHPEAVIVLLTMHRDPELVQRALAAGVRGYVYKLTAGEEVIAAVRSVLRGEIFVSPSCRNPS